MRKRSLKKKYTGRQKWGVDVTHYPPQSVNLSWSHDLMFDSIAWGLKIFRESSRIDLYEWNSSQFAKIPDANALNGARVPFDLESIRNSKQFIKGNPSIYRRTENASWGHRRLVHAL